VHGVALATALGKGFTSNGRADTVTVFDLKTLKTLQTVQTGKNPDAIIYEPVTKRVFAFNGRSKDATVISAEDLSVVGTIALGGKPEFAAVDEKGKVFVNIEDTSEAARIDAKSLNVEQRWALAPGEGPSGLAIDPAHHFLFSVCGNERMIVTDTETGKVLASPAIGKGVDGAAFDAAGGFALASNGDGTMTVIATGSTTPFTPAQTLKTAPRARTLVIDPKTRRIYLPTAEFEPPAEPNKDGVRQRPTMKPGTFKIVVVEPSRP
jgi:DNA-binding beta-propeller fold protein YncE